MGECLSALLPAASGPVIELEAGNNVECCVTERTHSPFNMQREPDDSEASFLTNIPERFEDDGHPTVKD